MAVWRTQFERINFDFDPALRQTADVVFETDIPFDDDHLGDFESAAWDAMWTQNPHWKDYSAPLKGYSGWSSVLGGHKYEEVKDVDLDFDLGEPGIGLPRIAETFKRRGVKEHHPWDNSYRVTSFYKTYVSERKTGNEMLDEIVAEIKKKEGVNMTATERARKDSMMKIVQCTREEAEFVGGAGVSGCIARLEDIIITGRVNWEDRTIARARRNYKIHDDWPTEIWKYWEK